jgi:hypothetical protein
MGETGSIKMDVCLDFSPSDAMLIINIYGLRIANTREHRLFLMCYNEDKFSHTDLKAKNKK